jgi:hypothetical protein
MLEIKNRGAATAFVGLIVFGLIGTLASQQSPKSIHKDERTTTNKYAPGPLAPFRMFFSSGLNDITKYCNSYPENEKKNWPQGYYCDLRITDVYIAFFGGLLVFVTGGLVWIGYRQIVTTRAQLRAYVNVVDAVVIHANDEWSPNFRIKIKNNGQTPAYKVIVKSAVKSVFIGQAPGFDSLPKESHYSDLGPGQDRVRTLIIHHDPWQIMKGAIKSHVGTCYVYGEIVYYDIFRVEHYTRFRLQVEADDEGVSDGGLFFSPEGNESN